MTSKESLKHEWLTDSHNHINELTTAVSLLSQFKRMRQKLKPKLDLIYNSTDLYLISPRIRSFSTTPVADRYPNPSRSFTVVSPRPKPTTPRPSTSTSTSTSNIVSNSTPPQENATSKSTPTSPTNPTQLPNTVLYPKGRRKSAVLGIVPEGSEMFVSPLIHDKLKHLDRSMTRDNLSRQLRRRSLFHVKDSHEEKSTDVLTTEKLNDGNVVDVRLEERESRGEGMDCVRCLSDGRGEELAMCVDVLEINGREKGSEEQSQ
jgi:hypothetical protein